MIRSVLLPRKALLTATGRATKNQRNNKDKNKNTHQTINTDERSKYRKMWIKKDSSPMQEVYLPIKGYNNKQ